MATGWEALRLSVFYVLWPGLAAVSVYAVTRALGFYRSLRHSAPGLLVLLTTTGWVLTLAGVALVTTLYLSQDPEQAGPVALPVFVLWAGSMVTIVFVVQRWGQETSTLDAYYGDIERMDRMKSGFINHVAHELNTPMTPLRMQVAILKGRSIGPLTEKQETAVERMERNVERIGSLVDQILTASSIQSGRLNLDPDPVDVADLVRDAAHAVARPEHPVEVADHGAMEATIDRRHVAYGLRALFLHLAPTSTPESPVRVEVHSDGHWVDVDVHHDGPPLDGKNFEAFADPDLAADRDGIAIGLFNLHGIVDLHGGRIDATHEGRSRVRVRLPVHETVKTVPVGGRAPVKRVR